jgi:hypothetical protein
MLRLSLLALLAACHPEPIRVHDPAAHPATATCPDHHDTAELVPGDTAPPSSPVGDTGGDDTAAPPWRGTTPPDTGAPPTGEDTAATDPAVPDSGGTPELRSWYADTDGDGYGDGGAPVEADAPPSGFVDNDRDCDDDDATVNPAATETCDGKDNDCDGEADEAGATGAVTLYADADADGWGDAAVSTLACDGLAGWTTQGGDCDDADASAFPDAPEVCDGDDEDCDGEADEDGASDAPGWFLDQDGDGFGDTAVAVYTCAQPAGYVATPGDCIDTSAAVFPGATETCDGIDEDCDGAVDDDATGGETWYPDADGDGFGDADSATLACEPPAGFVADGTDCADDTPTVHPGAEERCNGTDDDCDGAVDEDAVDPGTWYADADGDGFGDPASTAAGCDAPAGYVDTASDCADGDASRHPGAVELCNGTDDDCDGSVDEDAADRAVYYVDADGDGFGDAANGTLACGASAGLVADATDCDDTVASTHPGADEVCDGEDNDCAAGADEDAVDAPVWYADADGDGWGDATAPLYACAAPAGWAADSTDCDDTDATIHPDAGESCNGIDDDCDGVADAGVSGGPWHPDVDGDGFGDASTEDTSCEAPEGWLADGSDCDDADPSASPVALEACDGIDNDCDGETDEGETYDSLTWYADFDGDGWGLETDVATSCAAPEGYTAWAGDCDDGDADVSPDGTESCNGLDDDCDGDTDERDAVDAATYWYDLDGDTYGSASSAGTWCTPGAGWETNADDCDDYDATINPDGVEVCNGKDDDCDGSRDEDALDAPYTWYADADDDGYGAEDDAGTAACQEPTEDEPWVLRAGDCDDAAATVNPGAGESCDGIDNDCDGVTDPATTPGAPTWYADADGDGYGDKATSQVACDQPASWIEDHDDCDDGDAAVSPGAAEVCGDGVDNDCDGLSEYCGPWGERLLANADTVVRGDNPGDGFGRMVQYVGDLDGDGRDEVLAGGTGSDVGASGAGAAWLYTALDTADVASDADIQFTVGTAGELVGQSGAPLDWDGDGVQDLALGAYNNGAGGKRAGAAYLVRGPFTADVDLGAADATLVGEAAEDWAGYALSPAGDLDGDGDDEVWVGAPYESSVGYKSGAAYLVKGGSAGTTDLAAASAKLRGEASLDRAGMAVLGGEDLDGDGQADVVVGAWGNSMGGTRAGAAYVVYGEPSGTVELASADARLVGETAGWRAGIGLAAAGDTDGDGLGDVWIGAYEGARAYLWQGAPSGDVSLAGAAAVLVGSSDMHQAGFAVSRGDFDGDGVVDALVGGYGDETSGDITGAAWVVTGPFSGTVSLTAADGWLVGEAGGDQAGYAVHGDGDLDGDGFDDVLVGAWANDGAGSGAGAVYALHGG